MEQREPPRKKSWAGVIVGVALIIAMLAACLMLVVVPYVFALRPYKPSVTSEVKMNLKAAFSAEKSYWAEKDVYSETMERMGFLPERNNRYLYLVSNGCDLLVPGGFDGGEHCGVLADAARSPPPDNTLLMASIPSTLLGEVGVHCEDDGGCDVTIAAAGNIDSDSAIDVWSISTKERVIGGETISPGMPYNHINDVEK